LRVANHYASSVYSSMVKEHFPDDRNSHMFNLKSRNLSAYVSSS